MKCDLDCFNCKLHECIHDSEDRVDALLKEKQCEYFRKYYQEKHDEILAKDKIRHKKYYKKHKRKILKKQKQYDAEHREQRLERAREYYEQHKAEINRKRRERYKKRKENSV